MDRIGIQMLIVAMAASKRFGPCGAHKDKRNRPCHLSRHEVSALAFNQRPSEWFERGKTRIGKVRDLGLLGGTFDLVARYN